MNNDEFLIRHYFQTHPYGFGDNNLFNLFKAYAEDKIKSAEDISPTVAHFRHIISTSAEHLKFPCDESERQFGQDKHDLFADLASFTPQLTSSHKEYIHVVQTLMPNKQSGHLLDVGCGRVAPLASIKFAENTHLVSAMDKHLLSPTTLSKLGVNPIYGYFDKKTDVEDFDFVTGRTPCGAIQSIVDVCSKNNKPYFIETCDCQLPIDTSWRYVLSEIDPDIKFFKNYAFNVDARVSQVEQISNNFYQKLGYDQSFIDLVNITRCGATPWSQSQAIEPTQEA